MASTAKVEMVPVVPTVIRHHSELPEGNYYVILTGFSQSFYLLRRSDDGGLYLVEWRGKGQILNQFDVHADGSIEYDDPNDRIHP